MLLVISEILGLFINFLTAGGKYSPHNRENFPKEVQMMLSEKPKNFLVAFHCVSKIYIKF